MSGAGEASADELADLLRRVKPVHVVAVTLDGKERPMSTAQGRAARWAQLARIIVGMADELDRVELRDRGGAVIESWKPQAPERDAAEPVTALEQRDPPEMRLGLAMVACMQRAVDHAVDRADKRNAMSQDMLIRMVEAVEKRSAILERMYIEGMRLTNAMFVAKLDAERQAAEVTIAAEAQAAGGDNPVALMQGMLGMLPPNGAAPPNGAHKP